MKALKNLEESIIYNQRSLKRLIRSVTLSQGQFSLILVCCNYQYLQQTMMIQVRELSSTKIQEIVLPKTVKTLYTTIYQQLENFPEPPAIMIFDLEKVEAIDELLTSTNQVRDEFRKKFCFPLVLWITDELLAKLIRLAPDFKSWAAATIKFELANCDLIHLLRLEIEDYWIDNSAHQQQLIPLSENPIIPQLLLSSCVDQANCSYFKGLSKNKRQEIDLALKDLKNRDQDLEPILAANIELIIGRDNYYNEEIDSAIAHYQKSLNLWKYKVREQCYLHQPEYPKLPIISDRFILEQQGIVLYNIALCYYLKSILNPLDNCQELEQAKLKLQESKQLFEKVNSFVLVAEVITTLGQVAKQMKAWGELEAIALEGLTIHNEYGNELQIAQDYGFLAEVALKKLNWVQAQKLSERALNILFYAKNITLPTEKNRYLFLLAKSVKKLDRSGEAIQYLEFAKATEKNAIQNSLKTSESRDPKLYLEILTELRSLYYEQGKYLQAFRLKTTQRKIAHQYGLLAFIGASQLQPQKQSYINESLDYQDTLPSEITASSRQKDINNLIERISRDDYKLTIIHGRSGVGKSSLVNAGLVPALNNIIISARDTIPVVVQVYSDWLGELSDCLEKTLQKKEKNLNDKNLIKPETNYTQDQYFLSPSPSKNSSTEVEKITPYLCAITDKFQLIESSILAQLKNNVENNLLTVIIFDQFEEFFFISNTTEEREAFYTFLQNCLNIPFVKIIFSMRADYLHYLLECDFINYLDVINNNILDKQVRYHLRDFSREDAYAVMECLTKRAKFNLEPQLIDAIVDGLADEKQQIRPIELQVVGSQLQEEKPPIKTLAQFQQKFGINPQKAKGKLIKNFLEQVILDCGKENEEATMQILFTLTNDNLTRASRTETELLEIIQKFIKPNLPAKNPSKNFIENQLSYIQESKKLLHLILEILIDSGLLFIRKEFHEKHYQLVHDYVVKPIRKRFNLEERLSQAELEIKQAEIAKNQAETDRIISQAQLNIVLKRQLAAAIVGIISMSLSTIATLGFWQKTIFQKQVATAEKHRADINSMTAVSEALFFSGYKFDALIESIRAGQKWQQIKQLLGENKLSNDTEYRIAASLQQAVYEVNKYNHLEEHSNIVWSVIFHPEGNLIASASADKTIKLWSRDGKLQKTLTDHTNGVSRISFSSDGKYLASASDDQTVKIWDLQQLEKKPLSLKSHRKSVLTVDFSPNSKILASGSLDKTIKIWNNTGVLLRTIKTKSVIQWVSFSPNGKIIAAANKNGTVQLWNLNGKLLATLKHGYQNNNYPVYSVNFSPDGRSLVTASGDKTFKIWRFSRNRPILKKTIKGHKEQVISASFSPDGKTIASSSEDKTIKIWDLDGTLLKTFSGHGDTVTEVSFSPDGQTLTSASYDKTIKLWSLKNSSLNILQGHQHRVLGVNFTQDSQILASASQDNTIKLWSRTGKLLNTLRGHTDRVASVSFSPDGQILASGSYDNTVKLWYFNSPEKIWNWELLEDPQHWQLYDKYNQLFSRKNEKSKLYFREEGKIKDDWDNKLSCFVRVGNFCLVPLNKIIPFFPINFSLLPHQSFESEKYSSLLNITIDSQVKVSSRLGCPISIETLCFDGNRNTSYHSPDFTSQNINLIGHTHHVMSVSFSPNNQIIASGSKDKTVKLWNRQGKLLKTLDGHEEWVSSVSFSPDGKMLASASDDGKVKLWTHKGVLLRTINAHKAWILGVSFSPDSQAIATGSFDNTVKLWSINGELLKTFLKGASDSITSVSFSPDGEVIASSSYDGKIKLWSLYDGSLLKTLSSHKDSVMSVSFSPDGKLLASGSRDNNVILWNLALDDLLEKGCSWVSDYLQTNPHVSQSDRQLCEQLNYGE
ncbi:eIF2A-related protein [Dapis sp. BLCC M126]|uniref:WD40 domain-containing protein n=1 Tax=Dapis sp. BLCC M126 TaxID=3400189 RepID=UPI003CEE68A5